MDGRRGPTPPRGAVARNSPPSGPRSTIVTQTPAQLLPLVTARRAAATAAWSDLLGGGAACRIDGSLSSHEGAKLREGEAAALGILVRLLRRRPDDDVRAILDAAAAEWGTRSATGKGRDWDAYRRGGDGALQDLRAVVQ